jgi:hypothetical protein
VAEELPLDRDDVLRKKMTPEERAAWEARFEEGQRKLQERIAYH